MRTPERPHHIITPEGAVRGAGVTEMRTLWAWRGAFSYPLGQRAEAGIYYPRGAPKGRKPKGPLLSST